MSADDVLKFAQIGFYAVGALGGTAAVLTYLKTSRTLLSPVNTEYQKRVIQRLGEVSDLLLAEFDPESGRYWAKKNPPLKEILENIHKQFIAQKDEILATGKFPLPGIPCPEEELYFSRLVEMLKTDPFLPKSIRDTVADLLENRAEVLMTIHRTEIEKYTKALAKGKYIDSLDRNWQ